MSDQNELKKTAFHDLHVEHDAKMVGFAGYSMPLHYEMGIKQEHLYCRDTVGLFDVSHMGQAELIAEDYETAAKALEKIVPGDVLKLKPERLRYSVLLNEKGGIEDDLMITHRIQEDGSHVVGLVVNAGRKTHDYAYISAYLPDDVDFKILDDRSLLALQGPDAEKIMAVWCGEAVGMPYMSEIDTNFFDAPCRVSRCGYTGEDGFELSLLNDDAGRVAKMLMSHPDVELIGLGARDSLRLEAGFCLYGHDIDTATSPIEADLSWIMNKRRRLEGGFLGDSVILDQVVNGPSKRRVGLLPDGTSHGSVAPAREGAKLFNDQDQEIGIVTSGGFGPTIGGPVAMGYVTLPHDKLGTSIFVEVRGRKSLWRVTDLPFTPYRTYNAKKPTQH
jgi:aminomethyltransferase